MSVYMQGIYTCHIPAQNQCWAYYQYQAGLKHLKDSKYQYETGTKFFLKCQYQYKLVSK
jgi:hypothetical protein